MTSAVCRAFAFALALRRASASDEWSIAPGSSIPLIRLRVETRLSIAQGLGLGGRHRFEGLADEPRREAHMRCVLGLQAHEKSPRDVRYEPRGDERAGRKRPRPLRASGPPRSFRTGNRAGYSWFQTIRAVRCHRVCPLRSRCLRRQRDAATPARRLGVVEHPFGRRVQAGEPWITLARGEKRKACSAIVPCTAEDAEVFGDNGGLSARVRDALLADRGVRESALQIPPTEAIQSTSRARSGDGLRQSPLRTQGLPRRFRR